MLTTVLVIAGVILGGILGAALVVGLLFSATIDVIGRKMW